MQNGPFWSSFWYKMANNQFIVLEDITVYFISLFGKDPVQYEEKKMQKQKFLNWKTWIIPSKVGQIFTKKIRKLSSVNLNFKLTNRVDKKVEPWIKFCIGIKTNANFWKMQVFEHFHANLLLVHTKISQQVRHLAYLKLVSSFHLKVSDIDKMKRKKDKNATN